MILIIRPVLQKDVLKCSYIFEFHCKKLVGKIFLKMRQCCSSYWDETKGKTSLVFTLINHQFSSVQLLSRIRLFVTPWTAAHQASLSITNAQSLLQLMSIELVMPSNRLILCHPLLLLPSIFPSIRVFSNESVLCFLIHCLGWS